ncbi:MAG: hypothetical protein IJD94_02895 [Clostridia bacterium]|nr:hypothetical protein [Clostridia bacterium]
MEKRIWAKPEMNEVVFAANDYVAACGDPLSRIYNFICTSLRGTLYYYKNDTAQANGNATYLGGYKPCGDTHQVEVAVGEDIPFYEGFVDYSENGREDDGEHVAVWLETAWSPIWGTYVDDYHAMDALSITEIEADKS